MDFESASYKRWLNSPWGNKVQGVTIFKTAVDQIKASGATEQQVKVATTIIDSLNKLGLLSSDGKLQIERVASSAVLYLAARPNSQLPIDSGIFVRAAAGTSMRERFNVLKQVINDGGIKTIDLKIANATAFSAVGSESASSDDSLSIYVATEGDKLGIALSKSALEVLFKATPTSGLANLKAQPEFASAERAVRSSQGALSFAFLSLKALTPVIPQPELNNLPVSAVALEQAYGDAMTTTAGLVTSPTSDLQKVVLKAFEGAQLPTSSFKLPADTAVSLSLDTRVVTKLDSAALDAADPSAAIALQQLQGIDGITLGLRGGDQGSLFPELYLSLNSSTRERVSAALEILVGLGMMTTGQNLKWASKEIGGEPTRYVVTPLGVGVYIAAPKGSNDIVVASSERALADLTSAAKGGASLDSTISTGLRGRATGASTAASLYLNFVRFGEVLDSVKGSLISMLGTSQELDSALDSAHLKGLGLGVGTVSYADGVLKIQSAFEESCSSGACGVK